MTPFHYTIIQSRDFAVAGEQRNVALLVASPAERKVWLRRGDLGVRAHLLGDEAAFVRALLDALEREARDLAREGSAAAMHAWMRDRARPTEDVLTFSAPAVGIAEDVKAEVVRLALAYLGKAPGRGAKAADKVVETVLRDAAFSGLFAARTFESGPATWRFPRVADTAGAPLVLSALTFEQSTAEGVLDAAFKNVGRAGEVNAHTRGVSWLTVATGPSAPACGPAFRRACELMNDAGLGVIAPDQDAIAAALKRQLDAPSRARRA